MNRTTWVLLAAVATTVTLYIAPYGGYLGYPFVLLSTFAHEMGHGVAALVVGGEFQSLEINADASGVAFLRVPDNRILRAVASAGGLLGPSLLAALFFALAKSRKTAKAALTLFGIACVVAVVLVVRSLVGILFVGTLGGACVLLGAKSRPHNAQFALAFIAVQLSLSVFSRGDYLFTPTAGTAPSDVAQIAEALILPYWFWGVVCGFLSIAVLALGVTGFVRSPRGLQRGATTRRTP